MNAVLEDKLNSLPSLQGIYQFLNEKGKVIYVGKAKNLRNRVRSYFKIKVDSPKTEILVSKIFDLQLIVTDSEILQSALESSNSSLSDTLPELSLAQKMFSAISKIINVNNENLDVAINLIR